MNFIYIVYASSRNVHFIFLESEGSSPVKNRTPVKEKRKLGKENISSDSEEDLHDEDADLDHNDAHLFHRRFFEQVGFQKYLYSVYIYII